jgi:tetratricopeptide (TPR) repeat protein
MVSKHLELAWHLLEKGENEAARAEFARAIAAHPNDSEALMGLGKALARSGHFTEALEYFRKALALAPGNPEAHYGASWAHWRRKEWREARSYVEQALALAPGTAKYHVMAASCAAKLRHSEAALMHLETAARLSPEVLEKRSRWALAYLRVFAGIDRLSLLFVWATFATLYSCTLSAATRRWWFLVASLPFLVVGGWNFVKRRYRRALWSFFLCFLWVVPTYFLVEWLVSR